MTPMLANIQTLVAVARLLGPPEPDDNTPAVMPEIGVCQQPGQPPLKFTQEQRKETRKRVRKACRALGNSRRVCDYMDLVVMRESSGNASVRHTLGQDADGQAENGLGPMGLSLRWHANKWPGDDEDPMFCTPEVSTVVLHQIIRRAVYNYNAENLAEVQDVFAGRIECVGSVENHTRRCFAQGTGARGICRRTAQYNHDCWAYLPKSEIGASVPFSKRRETALRLASQ